MLSSLFGINALQQLGQPDLDDGLASDPHAFGLLVQLVHHPNGNIHVHAFQLLIRLAGAGQVQQVGEKLRAMMPWIQANKIVDQAKN